MGAPEKGGKCAVDVLMQMQMCLDGSLKSWNAHKLIQFAFPRLVVFFVLRFGLLLVC